jgi:hypothetical protein
VYGQLILLNHLEDTHSTALPALEVVAGAAIEDSTVGELWLRDTILRHPEALPVGEIDASFGPLIPLGKEVIAGRGRIDALFVNPNGLLTIVECKLWRNPEARRKVIGQILGYAGELCRWSYADLQRQLASQLGAGGNKLFEHVKRYAPQVQESAFVDNVARSLRQGRFLLLVLGDGIREDIEGISYLFQQNALQSFTFGLIETGLYRFPDGRVLLQPRLLTRTAVIERSIIEIRDHGGAFVAIADPEMNDTDSDNVPANSEALSEDRLYWERFLAQLTLDDPEQVPPVRRGLGHVRMPLPLSDTWITAYRAKSINEIGVFLRAKGDQALAVAQLLDSYREQILASLPENTRWDGESQSLTLLASIKISALPVPTIEHEHAWLAETLNQFVNTLRPLLLHAPRSGV